MTRLQMTQIKHTCDDNAKQSIETQFQTAPDKTKINGDKPAQKSSSKQMPWLFVFFASPSFGSALLVLAMTPAFW